MSDEQVQETTVVETTTAKIEEDKHQGLRGLSTDELIDIIAKTRQEAADKRTAKRNAEQKNEEDAKKWREYEESMKTEAQKLADELASYREKAAKLEKEALQRKIADEFNLDPDLVEFVVGSDEDEMKKKAEKLAERMKNRNPLDLKAGERGAPVAKSEMDGGKFLMNLGKNL